MPRGKRTVFAGFCKECGRRTATVRLHKQKGAKTWKDFGPTREGSRPSSRSGGGGVGGSAAVKADMSGQPSGRADVRSKKEGKRLYLKFCGGCRKRTAVKLKEERHSSD